MLAAEVAVLISNALASRALAFGELAFWQWYRALSPDLLSWCYLQTNHVFGPDNVLRLDPCKGRASRCILNTLYVAYYFLN